MSGSAAEDLGSNSDVERRTVGNASPARPVPTIQALHYVDSATLLTQSDAEGESADEGSRARRDSSGGPAAGQQETEPVYFTDCLGRSFRFPWANAKTSAGSMQLAGIFSLSSIN